MFSTNPVRRNSSVILTDPCSISHCDLLYVPFRCPICLTFVRKKKEKLLSQIYPAMQHFYLTKLTKWNVKNKTSVVGRSFRLRPGWNTQNHKNKAWKRFSISRTAQLFQHFGYIMVDCTWKRNSFIINIPSLYQGMHKCIKLLDLVNVVNLC